jgi:hypothetical protein
LLSLRRGKREKENPNPSASNWRAMARPKQQGIDYSVSALKETAHLSAGEALYRIKSGKTKTFLSRLAKLPHLDRFDWLRPAMEKVRTAEEMLQCDSICPSIMLDASSRAINNPPIATMAIRMLRVKCATGRRL